MTATIVSEKATETVSTWEPKATDRCDRCSSSRAYTRATKDGQDLFFCGHHTKLFETTLITSGWDLDIRLDILEEECRKYKAVSIEDADNA